MAWIKLIPFKDATGAVKRQYDQAIKRSGRLWNIVKAMSPNPRALSASMGFYTTLMHGPSPLARGRREMLAVVVSAANRCLY